MNYPPSQIKLDTTFVNEIKKQSNGDGSREAMLAFTKKLRAVALTMSNPKAPILFTDCIKTHGRVPVAICLAVTVKSRQDRLKNTTVAWGLEVLKLWKNRPRDTSIAIINDGLHPSRIAEYAGSFTRLTMVE